MLRTLRSTLLSVSLLAAAPQLAQAQEKQIELRLDAFSYDFTSGRSTADLRLPGTAAAALYFNDHVALEARLLGISRSEYDLPYNLGESTVTNLRAALFLPVHLGDARGRSGLFVAPGIALNRASRSSDLPSNDGDVITTVNYGVDLGFKHTLKGRVSWRHALTYRTGDDLDDTYGVTSGISIFFR